MGLDRGMDSFAALEIVKYTALLARDLDGERMTWRARVSAVLGPQILRELVPDRLQRIDDD